VRKLGEKKDAASYRTIMSLLLEHPTLAKSCINLPNKAGETLLCLAVQAQDCSTVTQLLQHPEWEEVRDENNGIPVLVAQARERKNKELATLLEACRCTQRTPSTSWHRTLDTFRQIRVTYHALEKINSG
jgi:hypothetical protein